MRVQKLLVLICTAGVLCISFFGISFAQSQTERYNTLQKEIEELSAKLSEARNRATTLANQIVYMDNQIRLTTLTIEDTSERINNLEKEITSLSDRIRSLEHSLTNISKLLIDRVVATYKNNQVSLSLTLFTSDGFSEFISRAKYLALVQSHDKKILFEVQSTKADFEEQKRLLEEKKEELDLLTKKLEAQKVSLDQQKQDKQSLLDVTRSDEKKYQELLSRASAERNALEKALHDSIVVGPVKRGDVIGLVGNTGYPGCSDGKHLHLEIRKDDTWIDPANYLNSNTVYDEEIHGNITIGTGDWAWPISNPIRLTQHFGHTPYSWRYKYSGGVHTGLDMVPENDVIRAPADGTLFKSTQNCGASSQIKIVYIEHSNGIVSFYLHVQ